MSESEDFRAGHVELFVRDVAAGREFWEGVLGFEVTAVQHGGRVVWLRLGAFELLLREGTPPGPGGAYGRSGPAVVLYTHTLAATLARLKAQGLEVRGDDGPGCHTFHDPDGNWIQLVDPRHA